MSNMPKHMQDAIRSREIDKAIEQVTARPEPSPPTNPAPTKTRLTPEEIIDQIHQLARHGEGADARWALKQLSVGDAAITLPKPQSEDDITRRAARVLKAIGVQSSQRAFRLAHPRHTPTAWTEARRVNKEYLPTTINQLYEHYPEAEKQKDGSPPGYPHDGTLIAKRKFIARLAHSLEEARKANGVPTDGQSLDSRP